MAPQTGRSRYKVLLSAWTLVLVGIIVGGILGFRQGSNGRFGIVNGRPSADDKAALNFNAKTAALASAAAAVHLRSNASHVTILNPVEIEKATIGRGTMTQIRRFATKLLSGEPVTVGVVGGSVASGHGADNVGTTDFAAKFFQHIREVYPHPDHKFVNGAMPGTHSGYMALCVRWHVPENVDLVVVEYGLNDDVPKDGGLNTRMRRSHERLLRRLLTFKERPALIQLGFSSFETHDFTKSAEDELSIMAQYYDIPRVSFRDLCWEKMLRGVPGYNITDLMTSDERHPTQFGHDLCKDLLVSVLDTAIESVAERPLSEAEEKVAHQALLQPIVAGNEAKDTEYCYLNEELQRAVHATKGFEWQNDQEEGRTPKWGFVGDKAGANIQFKVDTTAEAMKQKNLTSVSIVYLKSYEHMGKAEVTCSSGCTCNSNTFDSHHEEKNSVPGGLHFTVTQHKECIISVTILKETSSKEHKVKLTSIIIQDEAVNEGDEKPQVAADIPYGERGGTEMMGFRTIV